MGVVVVVVVVAVVVAAGAAVEDAKVLPRVGRGLERVGFVRPFVGGGVTDVDHCRMLFMYASVTEDNQ